MRSPRYIAGVAWAVVNAGAGVALPLAIFVVFARSLPPVLVGVVATAVACTEILKTIGLQGLYEALLQQQGGDRRRCHETAAFVFMTAGAALFVVYLAVLAALGAFVPDIDANYGILVFVGLRIVFDLATMQPQAELAHRLAYRTLALRAVIGNAVAGVAGIAVALEYDGLAGLVLYQAGQSFILFLTSVIGSGALARPRFDAECFRRMAPEASLSTCVRLVASMVNNVDQIMIGALLGGVPLAYFNLGKRIETTFITIVNSFVSILFQPLFARRDLATYDEAFRRSVAVSAIVCGIPAAIFLSGSELLIRVVFGEQWTAAAPVCAVLAIGGFIRASGFVPGALMSVSGRNRDLLLCSTASAVSGIVLVAVSAQFGIVWCAAALAVKNALIVVWMAGWLRRQVSEPWRTYLSALVIPFAIFFAGIWVGRLIVGVGSPTDGLPMQLARFAISLLPGAIAVTAYFGFFFGEQVRGYYSALRQR